MGVAKKDDEMRGFMVQQMWASRVGAFLATHNCYVIDVRDQEAYEKGHILNAVLIPAKDLEEDRVEIPRNIPILVYCDSGSDSLRIARLLSMRGYSVYNLVGGYDAYLRNGTLI